MEHLTDSKIVFLVWKGWSSPILFGFISVKKQSYWQNWHIFVKLLNSGPWLECKRKDVASENFALGGLLLILAISYAGCSASQVKMNFSNNKLWVFKEAFWGYCYNLVEVSLFMPRR